MGQPLSIAESLLGRRNHRALTQGARALMLHDSSRRGNEHVGPGFLEHEESTAGY